MSENLIYHYTSIETLFNIIRNKSFWLTDLRSSMDKNDMLYGENLVKEYGKKFYNKEYSDFAFAFNQYALSCTTEKDSFFHFQCYANNCKGVAIGINPLFMEEGLNNKKFVETLHYHLNFQKVIYNPEQQKNILEQQFFNSTKIQKNTSEDLDYLNEEKFSDAFTYCCSYFKKPEFTLENEIRFVYRQDYGGKKTICNYVNGDKEYNLNDFMIILGLDISSQIGTQQNYKFSVFNGNVRKYYNFCFETFGINNVIKSIIIGPKCEQNINDLNEFLHSNNLSISAERSKIELRI